MSQPRVIPLPLPPRVVVAGLLVSLAGSVALRWSGGHSALAARSDAHALFLLCASGLAYLLTFALAVRIADEHRRTPWMRASWLLIAGSALFSVARTVTESRLLNLVWPGYLPSPLQGLMLHVALVPANLLLLAGLLCLWWAFHRAGFRFALEGRDVLLLLVLSAAVSGILVFRAHLTESQSPLSAASVLQRFGLVVLTVAGALAVVQYRFATQMGDGALARALRLLTSYVVIRCVLVFGEVIWRSFGPIPLGVATVVGLCREVVPWLLLLAASCRAQFAVDAARHVQDWRATAMPPVPAAPGWRTE